MNWKKLMAVTMALCMAVPSGIPQTIMGAEFTQGTQTQVTEVSEFDDGMGNDCDETEAENIEDLFGSEDFSAGKAEEINDNSQDIPDLKENEGDCWQPPLSRVALIYRMPIRLSSTRRRILA